VDFFSTTGDIALPGVININGLRRDNGAALRAACYGLKLRAVTSGPTDTAPVVVPAKDLVTDESSSGAGLQRWIDAAIARMDQNDPGKSTYDSAKPYFGPFMERGEVSEFPILNSSNPSELASGVRMQFAFDRTREELCRRLLDLITTRGNIFSVYAIGQSISEAPDANKSKRVTATHQVKTTFALIPKKQDGTEFKVAAETFDPTKAGDVRARFAAPHHYDLQILQVSSL
jgi:hypothetical protein